MGTNQYDVRKLGHNQCTGLRHKQLYSHKVQLERSSYGQNMFLQRPPGDVLNTIGISHAVCCFCSRSDPTQSGIASLLDIRFSLNSVWSLQSTHIMDCDISP